jgi:hypothetical protein
MLLCFFKKVKGDLFEKTKKKDVSIRGRSHPVKGMYFGQIE